VTAATSRDLSPRESRFVRGLQRIVDVRAEEVAAMLCGCAYFFCVLSSYYIFRPLREEMGVAGGVRNLPFLYTGTLLGMLAVQPPFAALVAKLPRARFVPISYRFFLANLLIFFALMKAVPHHQLIWVGRVFFVWTSVFNLFVVSVFWGVMADVFRTSQGKRLFGFIGIGGTLGGILGSGITAGFAVHLGPPNLLLISAVLLELSVFSVRRLFAAARSAAAEGHGKATDEGNAVIGGSIFAGISHVARSPYLLGICLYMLLFTVGSTWLYFHQAALAGKTIGGSAERTAFFAQLDLAVNLLTLLTQAFLTGRLIKALGLVTAIALIPALSVVGFLTLGIAPVLAVFVVFQVLRRAGEFAVARPTREVLYIVLPREDKYKAKSFIDTFIYRAGDQIGAWSYAAMGAVGLGMATISFIAVPVSLGWCLIGLWLGRKHEALAAPLPPTAPALGGRERRSATAR